MKRKPSEYLADRRIFISCEPEEADLAYALNTLGEDIAVYSSDYPHWDCTFPGSVQELLDQDGLTEVQKRKILSQNALALLGSE